jgi:DNA-binding NarL/FixJ family response regulator
MPRTRILIADDHELIRRGIRSLLETRAEWEICGEASSGRDAVAKAARLKPDIVLLDVTLPDVNGVEVIP